jgi:serine/threonine protein kinase
MARPSIDYSWNSFPAGRLLEPWQRDLLGKERPGPGPNPDALVGDLVRRGWLTDFQAGLLGQGRGDELILGGYVLLGRLGAGGMGEVFKARHRRLGRVVALKVIRRERLNGPAAVLRFEREARLAARLNHPNVTLVFDADQVGDTHFFTMEYVEGWTLAQMLDRHGPLPVGLACDVARQAALGLQHAHEAGLVHRDVKPSNLLLARQGGVVKVADLGLACLAPDWQVEGLPALTDSGVGMGTADYAAPEQALDAHGVDIRADVYSLGCTLYHLLTGHPPFPGGSLAQKVLRHQQGNADPVESIRPEVAPALAAVVRRMMAPDPGQRYPTPALAAGALAPFAEPAAPTLAQLASGPAPEPDPARDHGTDSGQPGKQSTRPELASSHLTPSLRRRRPWRGWLVAGAVLAGLAALAAPALVMTGRRPGTDPAAPTHPSAPGPATLVVGPAGDDGRAFPTLREALAVARPGDRILVRQEELSERLRLGGDGLGREVAVEAAAPSGRPVVWHPPPGDGPLLELREAAGFRLSGFVLDGGGRVDDLVTVSGACPGLTLESLVCRGFRGSAVVVRNAEGAPGRPLALRRLRAGTGERGGPALCFACAADEVPRVIRHAEVEGCRLEGPGAALVEVAAPLAGVRFCKNRLSQAADGILYRGGAVDPRQRVEWSVESNTFSSLGAALRFEGGPLAEAGSRLVVRDNLFARTKALAAADGPPAGLEPAAWVYLPRDAPAAPRSGGPRFYRMSVPPSRPVATATLRVLCDSEFTAWVNGREVGRSRPGQREYAFDVAEPLRLKGLSVWWVALGCADQAGSAGFLARLDWTLTNGDPRVAWTSTNCRARTGEVSGWQDAADLPGWEEVRGAAVSALVPRGEGNVRDPGSGEGALPLGAAPLEFVLNPDLLYPTASPLARAGAAGGPVGFPPEE